MKKRLLPLLALFVFTYSLCLGQRPTLYGMTYEGITGNGTIFNYNITTDTETLLHNFTTDGQSPYGDLMQATNGLLYGLTSSGGAYDEGTLISYNILTGYTTDLYDFNGDIGSNPHGTLLQVNDSLLFGTANLGGGSGDGSLFSYNIKNGQIQAVVNFNVSNGSRPNGNVVLGKNNILYGLTTYGGPNTSLGCIYSYNINTKQENVLYSFEQSYTGYDGNSPEGSPIIVGDSILYGLTPYGGGIHSDYGSIFSYNINTGHYTLLYGFVGGADGGNPYGVMVNDINGMFYGMTTLGGAKNKGTIFSYNPVTNKESVVHSFGINADGWAPNGSLIQASDSLLYGLTSAGGSGKEGIIFSFNTTTDIENDLHNFGMDSDGESPAGDLVEIDTAIPHITPLVAGICMGDSIMLIASGSSTYTWSPAIGLNTTSGDTIIANPAATTTYTVYGTSNGHTLTTTVVVTVNTFPTIKINIPPTICSSESAALIASGGTAYTWAPATGLSATTGDSVVANPTITTTYFVTGTNAAGCSSEDSVILIVQTCTAINQLSVNNNRLLIYPNPSNGSFAIISTKNIDNVKVTNLLGQLIYEAEPKRPQFTFELIGAGMYFVTVTVRGKVSILKAIVSR